MKPAIDAAGDPPHAFHINVQTVAAGVGRDLITNDEWVVIGRSLRLSAREIQMLEGVFDGETEAGIARDLGISAHTVHTYLVRLYRKLNVNSRCELLIRVFAEHLDVNVGERTT